MKKFFGSKRLYNTAFEGLDNVVHWDVLHIHENQELFLEFISVNSKYKQGVRIAVDVGEGYVEAGPYKAKGIFIWEDTFQGKVKIKCHSPNGLISIYNVFDLGEARGGRRSLTDSCGMLVEEKNGKIIYRCNDTGFETDFDKLIFQIEPL